LADIKPRYDASYQVLAAEISTVVVVTMNSPRDFLRQPLDMRTRIVYKIVQGDPLMTTTITLFCVGCGQDSRALLDSVERATRSHEQTRAHRARVTLAQTVETMEEVAR
jgi:hypothetical protein